MMATQIKIDALSGLINGEDDGEKLLLHKSISPKNRGNLFIDGAACSGKSTLITRLCHELAANRCKVNELLDVTEYNYDSNTALHYLTFQILQRNSLSNHLFDRSPISNLAFQYVYWLMEHGTESLTPFKWCEIYTEMHHMMPLLQYIKYEDLNVIIIINTNYESVSEKMIERGERGDLSKGRNLDYLKCQVYAYLYLAKVLGYPVLNHADYEDGTAYDKIYDAVKNHYLSHKIQLDDNVGGFGDSNWRREMSYNFSNRICMMVLNKR